MVIFSMHVACYRSADCNKFCTGRHRKEPAFRYDHFEYLVKRDPALTFKMTFPRIERKYLIVFERGDSYLCQRRITVTTSVSPCNEARLRFYELLQLFVKRKAFFV